MSIMAKKDKAGAPKRRWYHNIKDSYTIVKRTFPWVPWAMLVSTVILVGLCIFAAIYTGAWISWSFTALLTLFLVPMVWLSALLRKAMFRQVENVKGSVAAVVQQLRRSWIGEAEPVAFNREQDLVWRLAGPPGVVLVGEGKSSRLKKLLAEEKQKAARVVSNVPVHTIECGTEEGQVRLEKLPRKIYGLPKAIRASEVPALANRFKAIHASKGLPIPKGIDPNKVRPNKRALRG